VGIVKKVTALDSLTVLADPLLAIHKVVWSRDAAKACMVASGGASGLLRIENTEI
jgi:hypothetical protein